MLTIQGGIEVCDGVFTEEEDYLFIATTHGSQKIYQLFWRRTS